MKTSPAAFKTVEWSYPTSENAKRFRFKEGCWTFSIVERHPTYMMTKAQCGFTNRAEALHIAKTNELPWLPSFRNVHPEDCQHGL